jgi:hypothetical protein
MLHMILKLASFYFCGMLLFSNRQSLCIRPLLTFLARSKPHFNTCALPKKSVFLIPTVARPNLVANFRKQNLKSRTRHTSYFYNTSTKIYPHPTTALTIILSLPLKIRTTNPYLFEMNTICSTTANALTNVLTSIDEMPAALATGTLVRILHNDGSFKIVCPVAFEDANHSTPTHYNMMGPYGRLHVMVPVERIISCLQPLHMPLFAGEELYTFVAKRFAKVTQTYCWSCSSKLSLNKDTLCSKCLGLRCGCGGCRCNWPYSSGFTSPSNSHHTLKR